MSGFTTNLQEVMLWRQGDYYRFGRKGMITSKAENINRSKKKNVSWKRGKITEFSEASRKRMKVFLAKVKWDGALFVTLTSRRDVKYSELSAFVKRYNRKYGETPVVWRKEYQVRGTVHYHMLVFTKSWLPVNWVIRAWAEILGEAGSVSVKYVGDRGKVWRYITKYMSKVEKNKKAQGDDGGAERERSAAAIAAEGGGILDNTIISCRSGNETVGRFWGYFGRNFFVFHPVVMVKLLDCGARVIETYISIVEYLKKQEFGQYLRNFGFVSY